MSLHAELHDLWASAPAEHRDALDACGAAVVAKDWDRALIQISTIPPGLTSWEVRVMGARELIEQENDDEDETWFGCPDDDEEDEDEPPKAAAATPTTTTDQPPTTQP